MRRFFVLGCVVGLFAFGNSTQAQESQAAKATRQKVKTIKVTVEFKEIRTADVFKEIESEADNKVKFKIDNASGVSNNTKLSYNAKDKTVEQVLNELSDKFDFGWVVISNAANNKEDGKVVIRKSTKGKERGYEAGKEPKGGQSFLPPGNRPAQPTLSRVEILPPISLNRRD